MTNSSSPDFDSYLVDKVKAVNEALDKAVPLQEPKKIYEAMRSSILAGGGRRIRAVLCLAVSALVGGDDGSSMPAACSVEMIHTTSIIQDSSESFGQALAFLAKGSLTSLAIEHLSSASISPDRVVRAIQELAADIGGQQTMVGHMLLDHESEDEDENEEDIDVGKLIEFIHARKTVKLVEGAVVVGAIIGGANDEEVETLRLFGEKVGLLVHVLDDIVNVYSSHELAEAKFTRVLGIDESKKYLERFSSEAKHLLARFDSDKALPLIALVDHIALGKFETDMK